MYKIAIYKDVKDQLDINVLKEINSNQLYDLGQAQTISKEIRKKGEFLGYMRINMIKLIPLIKKLSIKYLIS